MSATKLTPVRVNIKRLERKAVGGGKEGTTRKKKVEVWTEKVGTVEMARGMEKEKLPTKLEEYFNQKARE